MVMYCVAYGCTNEHDKRKSIKFHGFPFKRPDIFKKWIIALKRDNWTPTKSSKLCSAHFVDADYKSMAENKLGLLREDAVPSVFNFSEPLKKKSCDRRFLEPHIEDKETSESESEIIKLEGLEDATATAPRYVDVATPPIEPKVTPTKSSKLYSTHFVDADYKIMVGNKLSLLRKDAVPSVFNFPEDFKKKSSDRGVLKGHIEDKETSDNETKIIKLEGLEDAPAPRYVDVATPPIEPKVTPTESSKLYSTHFVDADYKIMAGNKLSLLREDAVPSVFNFSEHSKKKSSDRGVHKHHTEDKETSKSESKIIKLEGLEDAPAPRYVDVATSPIEWKVKSPDKEKLRKRIKVLLQKVRRKDKKIDSMTELIKKLKERG